MKQSFDLEKLLKNIDHHSYPAYKETKGQYQFKHYTLSIDHVQGDPFAAPSKISVLIDGRVAGFPKESYELSERRYAIQDYLLRQFGKMVEQFNFKARGSGRSGLLSVSRCGQEIIERTACFLNAGDGSLTVRLEAGFPAHGRTICSGELQKILFDFLPKCIQATLLYQSLDHQEIQQMMELADDRTYIRRKLAELDLCAFVADGSILPRESGVSNLPLKQGVPFFAPESLAVQMELPHYGTIRGMGIRRGVTLIVGGGYHGKSTLLKALELGVYDHLAGDGREFVITDTDAVKIRAEDGRSIKNTDISLFVNHIPNGRNTSCFSTEDASGSTSQAAYVIEAIESGTTVLLMDEDTSATNFMVRDELMQRVVSKDQEPITPFIDRVRFLYEDCGISTILVAGSSGAYFYAADTIIHMENYVPKDITELAKNEAAKFKAPEGISKGKQTSLPAAVLPDFTLRRPATGHNSQKNHAGTAGGKFDDGRDTSGRKRDCRREDYSERFKIKSMGKEMVSINKETINLHFVEQLVDPEQTLALGYLMVYAEKELFHGTDSMREVADKLLSFIETKGLAAIVDGDYLPAGLALPRCQEIMACLNRYRKLRLK